MYQEALEAQEYYRQENRYIMTRTSAFERIAGHDAQVKYNRIPSGFFPLFVLQLQSYLLGNGVTLDKAYKDKLGIRFDNTFQQMARQALVDGVNWGFWNVNRLEIFRATDFCPLEDNFTADLGAGIRFIEGRDGQSTRLEVFDEQGFCAYESDKELTNLDLVLPKRAYKERVRVDAVSRDIVSTENYPTIPIFPLYANENRRTELRPGTKAGIDAYDAINSDLSDGVTQIEGVYWFIRHFGGQDHDKLIQSIKKWKAVVETAENATAEPHSLEIPYQAKKEALTLIRRQLFSDWMAMDLETITGGSLTNVAIQTAQDNLDKKADLFGEQCERFIISLLSLFGIEAVPKFKKRTIQNDEEQIRMYSTMLADGAIDIEWYVKNAGPIADEDQEPLLTRLAAADYVDDEEGEDGKEDEA